MTSKPKHVHHLIPGPTGQLELNITCPEGLVKPRFGIVCHPLPTGGGTMNNKVVTTVTRAFQASGMGSVRFNFRGVGKSEGEFDDGIGEVEDLLAVFKWVQQQYPDAEFLLAGFSFGSYVAYRASAKWPIKQLICIAPPVHHYAYTELPEPSCPLLVVQGEADEIVPADQVFDWVDILEKPATLIRYPEVGHFFHGKLVELRDDLIQYLKASDLS